MSQKATVKVNKLERKILLRIIGPNNEKKKVIVSQSFLFLLITSGKRIINE